MFDGIKIRGIQSIAQFFFGLSRHGGPSGGRPGAKKKPLLERSGL